MLGHYNRLLEVMGGLSRPTACANTQVFPTDGANCKDSICNDHKMILGSHVKGPNNIICRAWVERLGLGHRTVVHHGFYSNLHKGEPGLSNNTFSRYVLSGSGP